MEVPFIEPGSAECGCAHKTSSFHDRRDRAGQLLLKGGRSGEQCQSGQGVWQIDKAGEQKASPPMVQVRAMGGDEGCCHGNGWGWLSSVGVFSHPALECGEVLGKSGFASNRIPVFQSPKQFRAVLMGFYTTHGTYFTVEMLRDL